MRWGQWGNQCLQHWRWLELVSASVCLLDAVSGVYYFLFVCACMCVRVCLRVRVALCFPSFKWRQRILHSTGEQSHYTEAETQAWRPRLCM